MCWSREKERQTEIKIKDNFQVFSMDNRKDEICMNK